MGEELPDQCMPGVFSFIMCHCPLSATCLSVTTEPGCELGETSDLCEHVSAPTFHGGKGR